MLFERLMLEINQAGLSWATILKKRAAFRAAYADFTVDRVAAFGPAEIDSLLADPGIIRNRLKIEAATENARRLLALRQSHGSFAGWLDAHHPRSPEAWNAALSPNISLHRWANRRGIPDECRLSARGARAGLPGLRSDPQTLAALVAGGRPLLCPLEPCRITAGRNPPPCRHRPAYRAPSCSRPAGSGRRGGAPPLLLGECTSVARSARHRWRCADDDPTRPPRRV